MIKLTNIHKRFGDLQVLNGIDLEISTENVDEFINCFW